MADQLDSGSRPRHRRGPAMIGAVRAAVEAALVAGSAERLTVTAIAREAGVHPTSIYRRWGSAEAVVADVRQYKLSSSRPLPRSGDVLADLNDWAIELADHLSLPLNIELLRGGIAHASTEGDCTAQWREEARTILAGDGGAGADRAVGAHLVSDLVVGAIVYRALFGDPLTREEIVRIVRAATATATRSPAE